MYTGHCSVCYLEAGPGIYHLSVAGYIYFTHLKERIVHFPGFDHSKL